MSGAWRAHKLTIDAPLSNPGDNPWTYFDTSNPYHDDAASFVVLDTGAIAGTPTTYESRHELSPSPCIWYVKAGKNTSPTNHTQRTGVFRHYFRTFADFQGGDAAVLNFNTTIKNHNPNATNYVAESWAIAMNGSFGWEATGAGAVAQFSEFLYDDCGVAGGVMDYTRSFRRTAAPHANGAPWGAFRIQSTGSQNLDYVLSIDGKVARGVDASPAGTDCPAPLIMAAGQWVYWNAVAAPDLNGCKLYATDFGNVRTGYTSNGWDVQFGNVPAFRARSVSSPSNFLYTQARESGVGVFIGVEGSDTNIDAIWMTKGSGSHQFRSHGFGPVQFLMAATASAVNFLMARGGATGSPGELSAQGSDANIGLRLAPKGNGSIEMPYLASRDYANDAAAAAGGVAMHGLYHTGGTLKVRLQ